MALFLWSAGQAQTPWTNWGIYRDSTGNGANPVSGGLVCADDTLWLVVDTNGMGAAGITGWRWRFQGPTPRLVYCPGTGTGCPSSLPDLFPFSGVTNERKLGIKPNFPGPTPRTFMLVVYLPGGDSLVSAKAFQVKGGPASLQVPAAGCAGSSVPAHVNVTGILDSFVVTYGTTTVRNQTDFSINLPSGTGTLDVTLTYYSVGPPARIIPVSPTMPRRRVAPRPWYILFTTAPMHLTSLASPSRRATPALSGRSMGTL
jgi:hypothetical protein